MFAAGHFMRFSRLITFFPITALIAYLLSYSFHKQGANFPA